MYNADDLMEIDGHYILPAVGGIGRLRASGGLSSIGVRPSKASSTLTGVNFNQNGTAWSQSFALDPAGRLRNGSTVAEAALAAGRARCAVQARRRSSARGRRSSPGSNFQGIGTSGPYGFVNSSSLLMNGRRHGDNLVVLKRGRADRQVHDAEGEHGVGCMSTTGATAT